MLVTKSTSNAPTSIEAPRDVSPEKMLKPTEYATKMALTSHELLRSCHCREPPEVLALNLLTGKRQQHSVVSLDVPVIQPNPTRLTFQNYQPNMTYELPIVFRNIDTVAHSIKILQADNPYFVLMPGKHTFTRVAAGLTFSVIVAFTPEDLRDYKHELICATDREIYSIPVNCIGPRAVLDIPDEITFDDTPIRHTISKSIVVRNKGNATACVTLIVDAPFKVFPTEWTVQPNGFIETAVTFCPHESREYAERLHAVLATGEQLEIGLRGRGVIAPVRLNPAQIVFPDTYVGLSTTQTTRITNESSIPLIFTWSRFGEMDGGLDEKPSHSLPTIYSKDQTPFTVDPVEGSVRPFSEKEIIIAFCPQEGKVYNQTAYCEITGRTERLALHVKGTGVGPKVQFSFACLDMGKIFIGSKHSYELVLSNVGCIDAMFTIRTADKHFGTCFAFTPDDGLITPGGYQLIQITFCSPSLLGEFDAVFDFVFDGCPEPRPVRFRGAVVGPTFHTNVSEVDFGEISPGFSSEKWIDLKNTSLIPMEFALRVQKKSSTLIGTDCRTRSSPDLCANSGTHFEKDRTTNSANTRRVRFTDSNDLTVQPSAGLIDPVSSTNFMISCSPTELGLQEYVVVIDVVGVGQAIEQIPVKIRCVCPSISISPKELNLRRCFLRHPYPVTFTLTNESKHPASFQLTDLIASRSGKEETENENELEYSATQTEGKIDALSTVFLPIVFKARSLGQLERNVKIKICGLEENPLIAHVSCTGEGPVLYIEPTSLNWGTIPVLEASDKTVKITNESAIPASFTIRMVAPDSIFRAIPDAGVVPPLGRVDVTISAVPDDLITFKDQMEVTVSDTLAPRQVNLMATGQGCTFVSDPVMPETLHLGTQFSARPVHATFHLTNKGRRTQQLIWTIEGQFVRKSSQGSLKPEELESHWSFDSTRFELGPGGSRSLTLEVVCSRPMLAKRRIFCHHIIGRKGVKTLVKTVDVSVEFIAPLVHLSHQQLTYRVVKEPYDTLKTQLQTLNIKNDSGIPLTCRLEISEPFYLIVDGAWISHQVLPLDANEMSDIQVLFDPTYKDDLHSRRIEKLLQITYEEHPSMNTVQLFGEVHFPNLTFDTEAVRFGYILNHTEITRHVLMTNSSPLPVRYRWTFLVGNEANIVFRRQTHIQEPYLSPVHWHKATDGDASRDGAEGPLEAKEEDLIDSSLQGRTGVDSPSLRINANEANGDEQSGTPKNTILEVLLEQDHDVIPLGIEEIFDITPVFGELAPGATQSVSFVFYGHADIEASVRAICEVDGGPTYTMEVSGGASQISYHLDHQVVEFEPSRFDRTVTQELELSNTGRVDFEYAIGPTGTTDGVLNVAPAQLEEYQVNTGQLTVEPATGYLASGETRFIRISYLSRKPETFVKYLQLQVGHFEPQTIIVRGVADFPRVNLDLPRFYSLGRSEDLKLRRTDTKQESNGIHDLTVFESSMGNLLNALYGGVQELVFEWEKHSDVPLVCSCRTTAMMQQRLPASEHQLTRRNDLDPIFCHEPKCFVSKAIQLVLHGPLSSPRNIPDWVLQRIPDIPFQMEAERFHVCDLLEQRTLTPDVWISVDAEENISTRPYRTYFDGLEVSSSAKKLKLPSYLLDFGVVVFGAVARRVVRTINTGYEPVSFRFDPPSLKHAEHMGFTPSISRIRNLPGAPEHDWIEWEIAFDPKGANVPTGLVETKLMINIIHGPLIPIHLRAQVVVPVIEAHLKNISFGQVQRGEARLITVQLENPSPVAVNWSHAVSSPLNRRRILQVDKHPAFNPPVFEIIPKQGKLEAGEKTNVQMKFAPTEQKAYAEKITLKLSESSEILCIHCHGQGVEPQLTFEMTMIRFPACLPFSQDNDCVITVTNPCDFPIEFYSTEFDPISYEQDQILRSLGGYDTHGLLLLPPRKPGEGLPEELVSYYEQLTTREMEKSRDGIDDPEDSDEDDDASFLRVDDERKLSRTTTSLTSAEIVATTFNSNVSNSQVEPITPDLLPVSLAISRYLGVNQPSETIKKSHKAGIAIIVHGPLAALRKPFIQNLGKEYQSTVLSVDQIVLEALAASFSEAANRARQLCMEAGRIHTKTEGVISSGSCETGQKPPDNDEEPVEHSMGKLETSVVFQQRQDSPHRKSSKPPELTKPATDTESTPRKMSTHAQKQEGRQTVSSPLQPTISPQMASGPPSRRISLTGVLPPGAPTIALSPSSLERETNTLSPEELGSRFMYSTLLPDDVIVSLIRERISAGDCHKSILFDGLDCSFTKSRLETARLILKALQDRQYVYAVSAISDFAHFKALEEQVLATQTAMQMAREAARQKYADEITESEYNELSEEERQEVNELRVRPRKEKRQVELEQQRLREEQERIEQEAELKRLELEQAHRRKGRRSSDRVPGVTRPQTTTAAATTTTAKTSESGDQKQPASGSVMTSLADSSQTERLQSQPESRRRLSHGSGRQRQAVNEEPGSNESDRLLYQIFKTFNAEFPSICALFGKWDRVTTTEQQLTVSDDMCEGPSSLSGRRHRIEGSARGSSVGGPSRVRRLGQKRDSTEVKTVSPLLPVYCDQVDQTKLTAEQVVDSTPTDLLVPKETINICPTLGVTHLVINSKPELISNILEDIKKEISPTATNAENPPPIRSTMLEALSVEDIFVKRLQEREASEYPPFALLMHYLPSPEEIWDYLGLRKKMPTIEGPIDFSVVQYPPPRSLPVQPVSWLSRTPSESSGTRSTPTGRRAESSQLTYFQFYPSGCGDPIPVDQKAPEALRLTEETQIDEQILKSPPHVGKKFKSPRVESGSSVVTTARKKSSPSRGRHRTGASSRDTTPTDIATSLSEHASRTTSPDIAQVTGEKDKPLRHFRWIVPAKGEVRLKLRFLPNRIGQFDQVLNFELLGTRRVYQLYLHGECALPNICREPRLIYPERKRNLKPGEIVHRTYITDTKTFEFGPLLIEKGKERVLEGHFPENKSTWKLVNTSPLTVEMNLGWLDVSADSVFAIQPNSVVLIPGASSTIDIMAFPRAVKRYDATIVCTIKENPEPFMMRVACDGAIPLVEVDKKVFNFEKVLIQRKETRTITLYNPTQLPVLWKISGADHLGEEFSVPQDSGIIEPGSEFALELHFRAMKPFKSGSKRHLRLEVYDLENLAGVIQVEAIQVIAEAYDVLLDISFPKGSDGGIDFGILKVGEEAKHPIILKNKGPYEVSAELVFENRDRSKPNPQDYFAVMPNDVKLMPTDKPSVLSIFFYARNEYHIEDESVLCCRVIDSNAKGGSELIACIPIRLSARSVFSSFTISPAKEVNFGAIAVSSQKTEQVVIENCGQHEFRFSCVRMEKMMELVKLKQQIVSKIKSQPGGSTGSRKQRTEMPLLTIPQPRLQTGFFTISPASGSIPPGGTQTINIDCSAESQGTSQEEIAIEISDRNATLYPYGVPFTLKAEAHMPSIETGDITTIFEEHRICHDLSMLGSLEPTEWDCHGGLYAVAENRFIFPSILVGTAARARFCMANRGKVPADVTFEIRPIGHLPPRVTRRPASRGNRPASSTGMFSLEMERTQIDPYTSTYVTVTFTPQAMQKYVSNFLVYLENPSSSSVQPTSVRNVSVAGQKQSTTGVPVLNFELIGQGHLPSLTIVEPSARGRQGQIICAFKRVHVGRQVKRRLLLRNSGELNCGVNLTLVDADHVFYLEPEKENDALLFIDPDSLLPGCSAEVEYSCLPSAAHEASAIQMYTASILIRPGREYLFNLYYRPTEPGVKSTGQLKLLVVNNPYEDTSVELIGNALADEVCIQDLPQLDPLRAEYIHEALRRRTPEIGSMETVSSLDKSWDDIQILRDLQHNHLDFGDCAVSEEPSHTFTLTHFGPVSDQETATSFRFCWPTDHRNLQFIPAKGHLHPKQSRRITVKFRPNSRPVTLQTIPINCTLKRIRVPIPEGCTKPPDWDDNKQVIKWIDAVPDSPKPKHNNAENRGGAITASASASRTMPQEHPVSEYGTTTEVARRKRKVVETEPEPPFTEIPEVPDPQSLTLLVSAVADFARFSCSADSVSFQNTLMFQRRVHRFELSNVGVVDLHFSWLVEMLTSMPSSNESEVPIPLPDSEETNVKSWDVSLVPFSVQPLHGIVPPGRSISVEVAFSPLVAGKFAARLRGMFENLSPLEAHGENTGPMVQLEGVAEQPFIHFDLCESNYLLGGRRNPDRPGPAGQPLGGPLDPATRVIELWTIGVGTTVSKCFSVANLTSENLDFEIQNQDGWTANDYKPVICTTSHGQITSGRETEVQFTFTPSTLGITESFWRLYIEQLQFAVPLLVVGHTREPQVTLDRSHLNLKSVLVGHTISRDVYLINHESTSNGIHEPLQYKFLESSRYGPGRQDWIMVQPMSGYVNPGDRVPVKISFTAKAERSINIKLLCKVKYCERPLALNVKAEGYSMSISVFVESANEQKSTVELQPLWTPCLGLDIDQIVLEVNNTIQSNFGKYHRKFGCLDFGELDPGEVVTRRVTVLNCGKFGCDYAWMCSVNQGNVMNNAQLELAHSFLSAEPEQSRGPVVKVAPVSGNLQPGENVVCTFTFSPPKQLSKCLTQKMTLDGLISACLAIREGPAYGLQLTGHTSGRLLEFSTSVIDFGSQLVSRPGLEPAVRCLTLSNIHPSRSISVECLTPNSDVFQHSMRPTVLQPKASESQDGKTNSTNVCFTFTPKACKQYEERFTFEVNGSTLYTIRILGTGIKLRIQPVIGPLLILTTKPNGQQRSIKYTETKPDEMSTVVDLGSLRKNQQARRCVTLINKSAAPVAIYRVKVESVVFEESRTVKSKSNPGGEISSASCSMLSKELQVRLCNPVSEDYQLGLAPISTAPLPIVLEPKVGTTMVEVTFDSTVRIPRFTAEVLCELGSVDSGKPPCLPATQTTLHHLPVFRVQGYCEVHDIRFDIQSVSFGPVVCGGQLSKRLVLINSGDLGAKFRWVDKTIGTGLNIAPMEGFIAPNTEVPFSLTLRPTKLAPEIRFEDVTCDIDGVGPVKLTVTGACIPPKLIKGPIQFATAVRQQDTQTVKIVNPTNYMWKLRPVLDGPCWSGEQVLDIKPQETGVYKLVYKPMTMTREEQKHKGTVFFPLPDGTGLLYQLVGSADAPKPMFHRNCEVECRKPHVECINVTNWLNCTQRFQVHLSVIRPDRLDPGTSLNGVEYIEVPADGSKEYKLHFMGYRECTTVVRVTFTNESSGEYQFCELTFKTVKSKVLEVIRMRTRIRKAAKCTIQLHNPLNVPVTFNLITNVPEVQYPSQLQVPAKCSVDATLEYLPLFVGTQQGRLEVSCNELSTVAYTLDLEASPTPKEPVVQFDAPLGQRHTRTVRFMNYAKVKTEFTVSLDNKVFHCDNSVTGAAGVEVTADVTFEPTTIGNSSGTLKLSSPHAGEYIFPLCGIAKAPQPQGPLSLRRKETVHVNFRNVFDASMLFSFQVDNIAFRLTKESEVLRPKEDYQIPVCLNSDATISAPVTGKLVITCIGTEPVESDPGRTEPGQENESAVSTRISKPEPGEGIQWIYYLRGLPQ